MSILRREGNEGKGFGLFCWEEIVEGHNGNIHISPCTKEQHLISDSWSMEIRLLNKSSKSRMFASVIYFE